MAFCITFGTHDFTNPLEGYEGVTAQCHNCGNWSARCVSQWPFFTLCFVPVIPLSTHKYKLVSCPICRFEQDLSTRPDVQSQHHGAGAMMMPPGQGGGGGGKPGQPGQMAAPPQGYQAGPPTGVQGGMQYK